MHPDTVIALGHMHLDLQSVLGHTHLDSGLGSGLEFSLNPGPDSGVVPPADFEDSLALLTRQTSSFPITLSICIAR